MFTKNLASQFSLLAKYLASTKLFVWGYIFNLYIFILLPTYLVLNIYKWIHDMDMTQ